LGTGLNTKGDMLVAILPGDTPSSEPEPMVLLSVTDYASFAESVHGDPSGKVCRVTIASEDVLVAKNHDYAMLMNVDNRDTLELLLDLEPEPVADLGPLVPWIATNDITAAIMPAGAQLLLKLGNEGLATHRKRFGQRFGDLEQAPHTLQGLRTSWKLSQWFLNFIEAEVKLVSWGLAIDTEQNLRLGKRVLLNEQGHLRKTEPVAASTEPFLGGFENQTFVLAAGGPFPETWADNLSAAICKQLEERPGDYGFAELADEDWRKVKRSYRTMLESLSIVMLPGKKDEMLFSNILGVFNVADAKDYLEFNKTDTEAYNRIMSQSTLLNVEHEVKPVTVSGKRGYEFSTNFAAMMRDPNVPIFNWMLKSMFGDEGKLRYQFVATDKRRVVYGLGNEQQLTPLIKSVSNNDRGLAENADVQKTVQLLSSEAPWKLLISPQGCVRWAVRFANEFLIYLDGKPVSIPEFPASPPIGFCMQLRDSRLEGDMVWPAETLKAISDYITAYKQQ